MESKINRSKLIQLVADSYTVEELAGFLEDYFTLRLDHIVDPRGLSLNEVVRLVVGYFERQGYLADLVRELGHDRPGRIDTRDLLLSSDPSASVPTSVRRPIPLPQAATNSVKPTSSIILSQSNKDKTFRKNVSNHQRFPLSRLIIAILACLLLVAGASIWILNVLGNIKGDWSSILPIVFVALGVIFAFLQWILPLPTIKVETVIPSYEESESRKDSKTALPSDG